MPVFDKIGRKITQTSQDAIQKTKEMAETAKLNGLIADEEKYINDYIFQIGKIYFDRYSDHPEDCFKQLVMQIKNSQSKIMQYNETIKQLRRVTKCPNCGGEVPFNSVFCSTCGNKMPINYQEHQAVPGGKTCHACGIALNEGDVFCTGCGTKVASVNPVPPQQQAPPMPPQPSNPIPAADPEPQPVPMPEQQADHTIIASEPSPESEPFPAPEFAQEEPQEAIQCPNCNKLLAADLKFCTGCGQKVEARAVAETVPASTNQCPNCSKELKPGAKFCTGCGHNLTI